MSRMRIVRVCGRPRHGHDDYSILRLQTSGGVDGPGRVAGLGLLCLSGDAAAARSDHTHSHRHRRTGYAGADAEKVEQEVSRKIEKQLSRCGKVEKVYSLSRQNLSVVFVELFDSVRDTEQVWQDLQGRLDLMTDLPTVMGRPLKPSLNKDFGEHVAVMLTISSPKVSDFEIAERARSIRGALAAFCRPPRGPAPEPPHGRARLSAHGPTVLRAVAGAKPAGAVGHARPHLRRPHRRGAQYGLSGLSIGPRGLAGEADCPVHPLGPRHGESG